MRVFLPKTFFLQNSGDKKDTGAPRRKAGVPLCRALDGEVSLQRGFNDLVLHRVPHNKMRGSRHTHWLKANMTRLRCRGKNQVNFSKDSVKNNGQGTLTIRNHEKKTGSVHEYALNVKNHQATMQYFLTWPPTP
jgi:hypothetical protein